jgi:Rad3-related DNA helicase
MTWNLYENNKFLEPLKFSNGKTQQDIVEEVLGSIKKGNKIIFIHGICGTGKSAIALNIAKKLGKASIVVPIKNLQEQYKKDYNEGNKYLLKDNKKKLKISVITGRKNHKCKFLEENKDMIPKIKREVNLKLHDIFSGKKEISKDISADKWDLPCKIEIKEKNSRKIKEYLRKNRDINYRNFKTIKDVKRMSVAGACPYWSPVIPEKYEPGGKSFSDSIKKKYSGLDNTKFIFYQRKPGCKFYEQFDSFIEADVIVFNSMKYKLESALNRKPLTEVEIIDECDEFLDSFSNHRTINIDRLQNSIVNVFSNEEIVEKTTKEISAVLKQIKRNKRVQDAVRSNEIIPLKETGVYDLLKIFLLSSEFLNEVDEESYLFDMEETAFIFEEFLNESYVVFNKKDESLIANVVTTNLAKRFKEIVDKNKAIVLMSGTLHSEDVLRNIFGIEEFKIIEAETEQQGRIEIQRTGLEKDCRYSKLNFENRRGYLKALSKCVEVSKKPTLVHVNAFVDLPTELELEKYDIDNLISRERLKEIQEEDKTGKLIERFKKGKIDILFSTRASRGIDFPGEECNSIIFTKYPNPNVQNAFWKILSKTKPQYYWDFYRDKARRELWQKIYRGLRFKEDSVYVLSPDSRVLDAFENK